VITLLVLAIADGLRARVRGTRLVLGSRGTIDRRRRAAYRQQHVDRTAIVTVPEAGRPSRTFGESESAFTARDAANSKSWTPGPIGGWSPTPRRSGWVAARQVALDRPRALSRP